MHHLGLALRASQKHYFHESSVGILFCLTHLIRLRIRFSLQKVLDPNRLVHYEDIGQYEPYHLCQVGNMKCSRFTQAFYITHFTWVI